MALASRRVRIAESVHVVLNDGRLNMKTPKDSPPDSSPTPIQADNRPGAEFPLAVAGTRDERNFHSPVALTGDGRVEGWQVRVQLQKWSSPS